MLLRASLEETLKQWLLFKYEFTKHVRLVSEVEFPEQVLLGILQGKSDAKITIAQSLARRPTILLSVVNLITSWLGDGKSTYWKSAVLRILQNSHTNLSREILTAVVARLEDQHRNVRWAALNVLKA